MVVYNCTKRCNLKCVHCYSQSTGQPGDYELSTAEAKAFIDDLADFGNPVILFSGGEPLMRPDILELIDHAVAKGRRAVISTNGTLISSDMAKELKNRQLSYVGVSLDGMEATNDAFRGVSGSI